MTTLGQQVRITQPQQLPVQPRTQRLQAIKQTKESEAQRSSAKKELSKAESIEDYERIYSGLSQQQQSQFASPSELRSQQSQERENTRQSITSKINEIAQKEQTARARANDNSQTREEQQRANAEADRYTATREALQEGRSRIDRGENLSYDAVVSYAEKMGNIAEQSKIRETYDAEHQRDLASKQLSQSQAGNFSGLIRESYTAPGTKEEKVQGFKFFVSGREVIPEYFQEKFDIYPTLSGSQVIFAKGTDLSKISANQLKTLFPAEYEQARQKSISKQKEEASAISEISLAPAKSGEVKQTIFTKIGKGIGFIGDIVGSIIPDVFGSGSRGLEQTTLSQEEIITRRESIKQKTFNIASLGLFSISGGGAVTKFGGKSPTIIEADIESFMLRRDIARGAEEAKNIESVRQLQIGEINTAQTDLARINEQVSQLNAQLGDGKPVSQERASEIEKKYADLNIQRTQVYERLASNNIKTNIEIADNGEQTIRFSSPELDKDLASAYAKEFRNKNPAQMKIAILGSVAGEFTEGAIVGLALGGSGALAKIGTGISKIPGVTTVITKFPTASKIALEGTFFAGTALVSGFQAYRTGQEFKQQGLPASEGYLLGFAIPAGKALGFYTGAKIGTKFYTESVLEKVERGGFTKTVQKEYDYEGKKIKIPAEARTGKTYDRGGDAGTLTEQRGLRETKIPDTKIKISEEYYLSGKYRGNVGYEEGRVFTKVTRGQAPIQTGETGEARTIFIKPQGQDKTGIVVISKTKGGVNVDLLRIGTGDANINVLKEFSTGARLSTMEFPRNIEKVGETLFVKGGSLEDLTKIRNVIDANRLFTSFAGEDRLFAVARTKQLVFETAPKATGLFDTATGKPIIQKEFFSISSTTSGRVDAIKDLLKSYGISTSEQSEVFSLLSNKRGQLSLFFQPSVSNAPPASINFDKILGLQEISTLTLPTIVKDIAPLATSDIALRAFIGSTALSATGIRGNQKNQTRQEILQSQLKQLIQFNVQQQQPKQNQTPQQNQQQSVQQQLQQQFEIITEISPTSPPPSPSVFGVGSADFNFGFLNKVKKKIRQRRSKKELSYVQDFTSKILDTPSEIITEKQLASLVGKTQTGFESRPPVIVVKNNKDAKRLKKLLAQ